MNKAVIFDMDGVISNTQKYHTQAERKLLQEYGIFVDSNTMIKNYAGVSDEIMFADIFKKHKIVIEDISLIVSEKWKLMENLSTKKIKTIPYAKGLIYSLKKNKLKIAIASASPVKFILYVLKTLKIIDKFDVIVSADEVKRGKPAPDIFLLVAEKLKIKPQQIVVIEDGKSGMFGAKEAGMKCIGLVEDIIEQYPATKLIKRLNQISVKEIKDL